MSCVLLLKKKVGLTCTCFVFSQSFIYISQVRNFLFQFFYLFHITLNIIGIGKLSYVHVALFQLPSFNWRRYIWKDLQQYQYMHEETMISLRISCHRWSWNIYVIHSFLVDSKGIVYFLYKLIQCLRFQLFGISCF